MKQLKPGIPDPCKNADAILLEIAQHKSVLERFTAEADAALKRVAEHYNEQMQPYKELLLICESAISKLMKQEKATFFDGTDVVNLPHGSLIHSKVDKISIPKTALAECEAQHFDDVIKIVKSLDRDAIEKWPDAKLVLIGAERKTKEEYSYNLKKEPAQ